MSDRLERALRALRENEKGASPSAEATLDRILASRRGAGGAWGKRARMWLPIAAVLVLATTALARSGAITTIRALVMGSGETTERNGHAAEPVRPATSVTPHEPGPQNDVSPAESAAPDAAPVPESTPKPDEAPAPDTAPSSPAAPARERGTAPEHARTHALAPSPSAPAAESPSAESTAPPASDPPSSAKTSEADAYARAHRLHFDGTDPASALVAWDDYLTRYPNGRLAPEARYNRAIDLLKQKRFDEARAALQPFADGAFGGYHSEDARELLRSIP